MKIKILFSIVLAIALSQVVFGQTRAEQERSTFISNAKLLERKPLDPNAAAARESGFRWVVDTDQVTVALCGEVMELNPSKKNKFKSELLMQMTFGMAVFKLENPDKKSDEIAAQVAGVESMLRTYSTMVAENEKARNAKLDELIIKQNNGELKAIVETAFAKGKCEKKADN
ncbi:MAG: hypothetical protein IPM21_02160 [Acidobacteria bacterium]|nr:hypothetical protein [Acidobacteriota bacterium]